MAPTKNNKHKFCATKVTRTIGNKKSIIFKLKPLCPITRCCTKCHRILNSNISSNKTGPVNKNQRFISNLKLKSVTPQTPLFEYQYGTKTNDTKRAKNGYIDISPEIVYEALRHLSEPGIVKNKKCSFTIYEIAEYLKKLYPVTKNMKDFIQQLFEMLRTTTRMGLIEEDRSNGQRWRLTLYSKVLPSPRPLSWMKQDNVEWN